MDLVTKSLSQSSFLIERCTIHSLLDQVVTPDGRITHLEPRVMQLLVFMAERPDQVLSRELLLDSVWSDAFVCEQVLTNAVSQIRQAFGEAGWEYLQTIPKKGYRLSARVFSEPSPSPFRSEVAKPEVPQVKDGWQKKRGLLLGALLFTLVLAASIYVLVTRTGAKPQMQHAKTISIAVLPFQNLAADNDKDYLRFALSDRIATALTTSPSLAVRPSATTHKYAAGALNPQVAGRELRVSRVVTGEFGYEGDSMRISVELVDVDQNRVIWRSSVIAPARSNAEVERQVTLLVREQLLTAMQLEH